MMHSTQPSKHNGTYDSGKLEKRKNEVVTRTPDAKRPATGALQSDTVFRILVKESKVGSVIGKAGSIVRQLRDDTGARIRVVEGVPGCNERVIIISSKPSPKEPQNCAQKGLLSVHSRIIEGEQPEVVAQGIPPGICTRLLVCHSQAGSIIGRKGQIIKDLRDKSGAHIKILPPEELPSCALANDRVVQLVGSPDALRRGLELVSQQIRENPAKEKPVGVAGVNMMAGLDMFVGRRGDTFNRPDFSFIALMDCAKPCNNSILRPSALLFPVECLPPSPLLRLISTHSPYQWMWRHMEATQEEECPPTCDYTPGLDGMPRK